MGASVDNQSECGMSGFKCRQPVRVWNVWVQVLTISQSVECVCASVDNQSECGMYGCKCRQSVRVWNVWVQV